MEVVKSDKRNKKGVNKFSTGAGGVGAEARAAARYGDELQRASKFDTLAGSTSLAESQ